MRMPVYFLSSSCLFHGMNMIRCTLSGLSVGIQRLYDTTFYVHTPQHASAASSSGGVSWRAALT